MSQFDHEALPSNSVRYTEAKRFVATVLSQGEQGYVYAFPDKRLYTEVDDPQDFVRQAWSGYEGPVAMYLHVPYCTPKPITPETLALLQGANISLSDNRIDQLCSFCNLFTDVRERFNTGAYADTVIEELSLYKNLLQGRNLQLTSLYFGGGSPSLMPVTDMVRIREAMAELVGPMNDSIDQTLECIPDSVTAESLHEYKQAGFTRVSFGVQTFNAEVLRETGRNYDPELASKSIQDAHNAGFKDVNGDLILGLPGMTEEIFLNDIEQMITLDPSTITIYQNMVRRGTRNGELKKNNLLADQATNEQILLWSIEADMLLQQSGYLRVSTTCWAKKGAHYKQGEDIYDRVPVIGVGSGARSYGPNAHYGQEYVTSTGATRRAIADWELSIRSGRFPRLTGIVMDDDLKVRAAAVFGLMSRNGVSVEEVSPFSVEIQALKDMAMVSERNGRYYYTTLGKEHSGALGQIFYGQEMKSRLQSYQVK